MNYDCQLMPFQKLTVDSVGMRLPLCNDCKCPDCTNPIREKTVSVHGVPQTMRLYVVNNIYRQVVACKGYIGANSVVSSLSVRQEDLEIPESKYFTHPGNQPDSSRESNDETPSG